MPLGGGSCLVAQIEPTDPWCFSITCALSSRTRQTHVQWLALPYPSRLTIYTFRKENTFINTMIVVDLTSKGWVSSLQKMLDLAIKCSVWSLQIKDSWINSLLLSTDGPFRATISFSGKWALQLKLLKLTPRPWSRKRTFISLSSCQLFERKSIQYIHLAFSWLLPTSPETQPEHERQSVGLRKGWKNDGKKEKSHTGVCGHVQLYAGREPSQIPLFCLTQSWPRCAWHVIFTSHQEQACQWGHQTNQPTASSGTTAEAPGTALHSEFISDSGREKGGKKNRAGSRSGDQRTPEGLGRLSDDVAATHSGKQTHSEGQCR